MYSSSNVQTGVHPIAIQTHTPELGVLQHNLLRSTHHHNHHHHHHHHHHKTRLRHNSYPQAQSCGRQAAALGIMSHRNHHHHHHHRYSRALMKDGVARTSLSLSSGSSESCEGECDGGECAENGGGDPHGFDDLKNVVNGQLSSDDHHMDDLEDDEGITFTVKEDTCVSCEKILPWTAEEMSSPVQDSHTMSQCVSYMEDNSCDILNAWEGKDVGLQEPANSEIIQPQPSPVSSVADDISDPANCSRRSSLVDDLVLCSSQGTTDSSSCRSSSGGAAVSSSASSITAADHDASSASKRRKSCGSAASGSIPNCDELYEVTLTTGNIDKFKDLFAFKNNDVAINEHENGHAAMEEATQKEEASSEQHKDDSALSLPWLPVCHSKPCKRFMVQPCSMSNTDCECTPDMTSSQSDSNLNSGLLFMTRAYSSESKLVSPREPSKPATSGIAKPTELPLNKSNTSNLDMPPSTDNVAMLEETTNDTIPFPWSSSLHSSPIDDGPQSSNICMSSSTANLLPWESSGSVHSPSVSHDLDSICPQISCQSMRLSEVESHISHHSEPYVHHHQVLDIPVRRTGEDLHHHPHLLTASAIAATTDAAIGGGVVVGPGKPLELNLYCGDGDDDGDSDYGLDLHDRVMKWMCESEACMLSEGMDDPLELEALAAEKLAAEMINNAAGYTTDSSDMDSPSIGLVQPAFNPVPPDK